MMRINIVVIPLCFSFVYSDITVNVIVGAKKLPFSISHRYWKREKERGGGEGVLSLTESGFKILIHLEI